MKVSIRFLHSTNEKLIKRLPKDYDLVRIALVEIMLDGILTARLVIRENTLLILRTERSRNFAIFFGESVDIDWKSKITVITPKRYLTSLHSKF